MSTPKKLAASAAILAAVATFVSFGVFSAFSTTKSNTSSITSATFGLSQVPGTLLGTISNLLPGDNVIRCVTISNDGNVSATVALKPTLSNTTLGSIVTLKVEEVSGLNTTNGTCNAEVANVSTLVNGVTRSALATSYAAGTISGGSSKTYRITVSFPTSAVTSDADTTNLQNQAFSLGIDWVGTSASGGDRSS